MRKILKIILVIAAIATLSFFWPIHQWMQDLIVWVKASGAWGVLIYAMIYIIAILFFIPGSLLTMGAGFIYGPFWGTLLVLPTSVLGAFIAYSLARGRLRPWIMTRMGHNRHFSAIDQAVGGQGFKIVLLLRLSPLFPFTFLNYALGLSDVKAGSYVAATSIGMIPAIFLYAYIGSLVTSVTQLALAPSETVSDVQNIFMWAGFGVTVIVTAYVTYLARRALKNAVPDVEGDNL